MKEREQNSGGVGCLILGAIGFFLPPLYVLSIGPVSLLVKHYPSLEGPLGTLYFPLGIAGVYCQPIAEALTWYMELGGGR